MKTTLPITCMRPGDCQSLYFLLSSHLDIGDQNLHVCLFSKTSVYTKCVTTTIKKTEMYNEI